MTKILFENVVLVHAQQERVQAILTHPENLPLWDDEIIEITPTATDFDLTRRSPALNTHEHLTVTITANQVYYDSREGRLPYQLAFTLTEEAGQTVVTEALSVPVDAALAVPLKLVAPIAKQAFAQKLQRLAVIAESTAEVRD